MMQKPRRPTGITILAILELIGGIFGLLGGILLIGVGGSGILSSLGYGIASGLIAALGGGVVVFSLFALLMGWGMWTGKGWAWIIAVILYILGALANLASLAIGVYTSIVGLVIAALILWYLWRPHVKAFFGRGPQAQASPAPQPAPTATT
jgi:hypothetical protein